MQALHAILKVYYEVQRARVVGCSPSEAPGPALAPCCGSARLLHRSRCLKAGYSSRARATKDLDLAVASGVADGSSIRDLLIDALSEDPDGEPLGNLGSTS